MLILGLVLVLVSSPEPALFRAVLTRAVVRVPFEYEYRFAAYRFAAYRFAAYRFAENRFAEYE